jgi:hypothetical protein
VLPQGSELRLLGGIHQDAREQFGQRTGELRGGIEFGHQARRPMIERGAHHQQLRSGIARIRVQTPRDRPLSRQFDQQGHDTLKITFLHEEWKKRRHCMGLLNLPR